MNKVEKPVKDDSQQPVHAHIQKKCMQAMLKIGHNN